MADCRPRNHARWLAAFLSQSVAGKAFVLALLRVLRLDLPLQPRR